MKQKINKLKLKLLNKLNLTYHKFEYPVCIETEVIYTDRNGIDKTILLYYPYKMDISILENCYHAAEHHVHEYFKVIQKLLQAPDYSFDYVINEHQIITNVGNKLDTVSYFFSCTNMVNGFKNKNVWRSILTFRSFKNRILCSATEIYNNNIPGGSFILYGRRHDNSTIAVLDMLEILKSYKSHLINKLSDLNPIQGFVYKNNKGKYEFLNRTQAHTKAHDNLQYFHKADTVGDILISESIFHDKLI